MLSTWLLGRDLLELMRLNDSAEAAWRVGAVVRSAGAPSAEPDLEEDVELDAPWNVIVHNDPVNLMSYVVKVFMKVLGFTLERAEKHMLEVHHKGRSVVWTGEREKAELFVQQLHSYLLLATLEKSL
jgi:ATP-dependent Clp protease adaptor protein ClpS